MGDIKIITTSDGSHSLHNTVLDETYHSIHGAIQESQHVFIKAGLEYRLKHSAKTEIRILEVGFGTGLNAFLTLLYPGLLNHKIYFESWEAYPLESEVTKQLNYPEFLGAAEHFIALHEALWNKSTSITPYFTLYKRNGNVLVEKMEGLFDIIYYDAFAPSKQPDLWTATILAKIASRLDKGGILVTYCAKGQVKREFKSLGLTVESLPGPPGKMEMIRAMRL